MLWKLPRPRWIKWWWWARALFTPRPAPSLPYRSLSRSQSRSHTSVSVVLYHAVFNPAHGDVAHSWVLILCLLCVASSDNSSGSSESGTITLNSGALQTFELLPVSVNVHMEVWGLHPHPNVIHSEKNVLSKFITIKKKKPKTKLWPDRSWSNFLTSTNLEERNL